MCTLPYVILIDSKILTVSWYNQTENWDLDLGQVNPMFSLIFRFIEVSCPSRIGFDSLFFLQISLNGLFRSQSSPHAIQHRRMRPQGGIYHAVVADRH